MSRQPGPRASDLDLDRVPAETFVRAVEFHNELPSTNDRALQLAADPLTPTPLLVLAERQTAGRGRGANRWWSSEGALTFSLLLSDDELGPRGGERPKIALLTGLAVCETLAPLAAPARVQVKWPNDVLIDGRKVCGILIEAVGGPNGRAVIGLGINVNNSLAGAPAEFRGRATSLRDVTGLEYDRTAILAMLLERLRAELAAGSTVDLTARWEPRCALCGRIVQVENAGRRITGVCCGIDGDGALTVETESGRERVASGVVRSWQ